MSSLIILGTPRSGTSCVAGIVHLLGIHMGYQLKHGDLWNPMGYFQDEDLENILHRELGFWEFPKWEGLKQNKDIEIWAKQRCESHSMWGVKSNRIVYFLQSFLEGAGPDTKIILTERDIEHSKASWQARSGNEPDPVINIAEAIPAALLACNIIPSLVVNYDVLLEHPIFEVTRIARICGVKPTPDAFNVVRKEYKRFGHG